MSSPLDEDLEGRDERDHAHAQACAPQSFPGPLRRPFFVAYFLSDCPNIETVRNT